MLNKRIFTYSHYAIGLVVIGMCLALAGCTPTPEVSIPGTAVAPAGPTVKELDWLEPGSGSVVSATPTLHWGRVPGVSEYRLWIIDTGTTELVFDLIITENPETEQTVILPPLTPGRTYTWDVQGLDASGNLLARRTGEFKVAPQPAQIIRLDETWFQYVNYQFGFSINFPQTAISPYGSCTWTEANGDHSYRPEPSYVPLQVFEDGDTTYIAGEYYHELSGETKETNADGATRSFFSDCQAITNDLALLQNPDDFYQTAWRIVAGEVHDDAGLDAFLKFQYGSGCSLGEKVASSQEGVYDVRIQGDGKDLGETQCPLNRVIVVKYYPAGNRVVTWDRGQAPEFPADTACSKIYDQEMADSFQFLTSETAGPSQPMPPLSNDLAYTRVEIAEAGLSVDVPAGWLRLEPGWTWTPSEDSALRLGVAWADLQPGQEAEAAMLPASAVVLSGAPLTVDWGNGQLFTVAVYGEQAAIQSVEMHALVVVELDGIRRVYDLSLVAPDETQTRSEQVILQRMLDTAALSL